MPRLLNLKAEYISICFCFFLVISLSYLKMLIKIDIQGVCSFAWVAVIEPKFVCSMQSKARKNEASEFRAEEGLLQGLRKRMDRSCSKDQNSPATFRAELLKAILG